MDLPKLYTYLVRPALGDSDTIIIHVTAFVAVNSEAKHEAISYFPKGGSFV